MIAIIGGLVKEQPELEQKIRKDLPTPDISQMESQLSNANKNIYKSLPTSRLAKKTDSISYARIVLKYCRTICMCAWSTVELIWVKIVCLKYGGVNLGENRIYELSNRIWNMSIECNDAQIQLSIELLNNIIASIET